MPRGSYQSVDELVLRARYGCFMNRKSGYRAIAIRMRPGSKKDGNLLNRAIWRPGPGSPHVRFSRNGMMKGGRIPGMPAPNLLLKQLDTFLGKLTEKYVVILILSERRGRTCFPFRGAMGSLKISQLHLNRCSSTPSPGAPSSHLWTIC